MRYLPLCLLLALTPLFAEPPIINAAYVDEHFDSLTDAELDQMRELKIILASRSFGLNLKDGLNALKKEDPRYDIMDGYQLWNVFRAAGDPTIIPPDAFDEHRFVHFLATPHPQTKRIGQFEQVLREPPHEFAKKADVAVLFYAQAKGDPFQQYADFVDGLARDYPDLTVIYVTSGFMGPSKAEGNAQAAEFNEKVRQRYGGKAVIYDLGALLSADHRDGNFIAPEHTNDPADVHPNSYAGELIMGKGFLLALRESLKYGNATDMDTISAQKKSVETLPASHPEMQAVRRILDANGLTQKRVEDATYVTNGHITQLYLQEDGVVEITDDIGQLTRLEVLHCYGDPQQGYPLLKKISPKIGQCQQLRELVLTDNELQNLPDSLMSVPVKQLSVGGNPLSQISPEMRAWIIAHDPKSGLK
ncbi:hypothetical protein [Cerasicoccus fimbriatus]|uniref:hypothetical protein n=1 Tax=Cerasicoccus fimbriatus TaxID=3014554 RepID=UPI0022B53934|nr:hypothetical protein [Cerasicoccus sp. TK19100]